MMATTLKKELKEECRCNQCGYIWEPRVPHPKCCPVCIRRDWNKPKRPVVVRR